MMERLNQLLLKRVKSNLLSSLNRKRNSARSAKGKLANAKKNLNSKRVIKILMKEKKLRLIQTRASLLNIDGVVPAATLT